MWVGAGAVLTGEWWVRGLWLVAGAVLTVGTVSATTRARRSGWAKAVLHSVVISVVSVVVGAGVAGLQEASRIREPLAGWVEDRATARITGTLASSPTRRTESTRWALARAEGAPRVELRLRDLDVIARGQHVSIDTDVLVDVPGTWDIPDLGSRIEVQGRLGPASSGDVAARLRVEGSADGIVVHARPGLVASVVGAMRRGLLAVLAALPPPSAAVIAGLAVGETSTMPDELRSEMRSSGLAHLLAVSGGNVAIVLAVAIGLARLSGLGIRGRVLVGVGSLIGFVILVGPEASVLRAAAMGATAVLALLVGGRRSGLSVLAFATLVVLLAIPEFAVSWAFALSVAATLGLLVLTEPITAWLRARPGGAVLPPVVLLGLGVTLSAQLATLPLLVFMGAPVNAGAVPANLLAMPAVPIVTLLGLLAAVLAPLWSLGGAAIGWLAQWPASWIVVVARAFARATGPSLPSGTAGQAVVVAVAVIVGIRIVTHRWGGRVRSVGRMVARGGLACLLISTLLPWAAPAPWPRADWLVLMCDVGQGDAVLVRARSGAVMLVDTGPESSGVLACLRDARVSVIDLLVITHFHLDHVGGLPDVLEAVPIRRALVSGVPAPMDEARRTRQLLDGAGVPVQVAAMGTSIALGSMNAAVLWPPARAGHVDDDGMSGGDGSIPNNGSIVLLVDDAPLRLLLTGDIEESAQEQVMSAAGSGNVDVVKVPHHGSRAGAPGFAAWASARVALISVGIGNPYGHPADTIIDRWRATGARVCRTDLDGSCAVLASRTSTGDVELVLARRLR